MNLLDVFILVLGGGAMLIALITAVNLLLPVPLARAHQALEAGLGRPLLIGLVNFLFFAALLILLALGVRRFAGGTLVPILMLPAQLILLALAAFITIGLAAVASLLGARMGETKDTLSANLRGGLLLTLAALTPFLGWYLFTPFVVFIGLGAAILAVAQRRHAPVEEEM